MLMTITVDTLILARWCEPVGESPDTQSNSGVAIKNGKIIDVAPNHELIKKYHAQNVHKLDNHLLIPGFINTHTHAAMNLLKGFADDLPLMDWLQNHIWPAEAKWVSEEFVTQGSQLAIAEMLKSGTTCFSDMYFMPNALAKVASSIGIRANVGLTVIDFPTAWADNADQYIHKGLEVFDEFKGQSNLSFSFAPHAPYTVSNKPLEQIATLAEELDLTIQMHVHETQFEVEQAIKETGERPLARLHQLGLLSPNFMAVHMTYLNDDDIRIVKENGVHVIHCPESNMKLASGICPTWQLQQHNVNIALGTDSSSSNNDLDMLGEMKSAALLAKVGSQNAQSFNAFDILKSATIGGAKALGLENKIGSLKVGKEADIIAINLDDIATQPVYNPVSQLVYSATREQVSHVWVAGQLQLENRELIKLDEKSLIQTAKNWQQKIAHS